MRNDFYVQTVFFITLQQPYTYPLQETFCIFTFSTKNKTHAVWFISLLKYGDIGKLQTHIIIQICVLICHKNTRTQTINIIYNIYLYISYVMYTFLDILTFKFQHSKIQMWPMDHKTSHKGQFKKLKIEIYAKFESWCINWKNVFSLKKAFYWCMFFYDRTIQVHH